MSAARWHNDPVRRRVGLVLIGWLVAFFAAACGQGRPARNPADLILTSGSVLTMNPAQPAAEAVAIAAGKIVYVGDSAGVRAFEGRATRVIDLAGKMVLPGFQDSHIHLVAGGMELAQCNLVGLQTREEVLAKIGQYAAQNPQKAWIVGGGWELPVFPGANPDKADLDRVVPDKPAFLTAADGHSGWANSRALAIAGINAQTQDPEDGRIERRGGTREPSGTLREAAQRLIERHIPEPEPAEYVEGLRRGLDLVKRAGVTSIIEANASDEILEAYKSLDRAGQLTVRVLASIQVDPKKGPDQVPGLIRRRETFVGQHLKSTTVKIFVDGVIESHTAALLEPYLDRHGDRGRPLLEPADFNRLAVALEKAGFQIHIHAIGDRAVRLALDAFEAARRANGPLDLRHHIAHLELIDPADVPRFKALGVVANFQPLWAYPDLYITQLTEPILGPERSGRLYPIGSVFRSGALIVGGSDWPVSSLNPLEAIQVAVTRRAPEDKAGLPWLPDQCIDLKTALAAYTTNGAFLAHRESEAGAIESGKVADLIVLDRNLLTISPFEIHEARVLLTLLEGKVVYRDPVLAAAAD